MVTREEGGPGTTGGQGIAVHAAERSWWHRFLMFCCDDSQNDIGKPDAASMPDNGLSGYDYGGRPIHG